MPDILPPAKVVPRATRRLQRIVERMISAGITKAQIAESIGISVGQLEYHFKDQLANGLSKSIALAEKSLYQRGLRGDTQALIFWLKSRAGWRDKDPMQLNQTVISNPDSDLSQKKIEQALYAALNQVRVVKPVQPALPAPEERK